MFNSKKPVEAPSFETRLNAAHATAEAAVSSFELIASDLESAAVQKRALVVDIDGEIDRLYDVIASLVELRDEADLFASANEVKAGNIRALVSA